MSGPTHGVARVCPALVFGVTLGLALLLGASPAIGFSCAPRDPRAAPTEALQGKWTVVEGVIEAESLFGLRFRVDRAYAGDTAHTVTLPGQSNANRVGQPWTFYVQRTPIAYDYTDCGASHPGLLTPEEHSVLGAGAAARPDEQGLGPAGNLAAAGAALATMTFLLSRRNRRPPLTPAGAHP